jgi:hypothetical protein
VPFLLTANNWRSKLADGEWFIKGTPAEAEAKKVFQQIKDAHYLLIGMSRLQPKVGIYVSDATWLQSWNPVWTDLLQQAIVQHWQVTIVSDGIISEELAAKMPVLISVNNSFVSQSAQQRFKEYITAGGHVFTIGDFAKFDELGRSSPANILSEEFQKKIIKMDIQPAGQTRTLNNKFSTGQGAWVRTCFFNPVSLNEIKNYILKYFPQSYLSPLSVTSVEPNANINVYTLTDGTSLLAVLINRSASKISFELKHQGKFFSPLYYDVLDKQKIQGDSLSKLTIEPYQVKLIWLYPDVSQKMISNEISKAEKSLQIWQEKKGRHCFPL